MKAVEYTDYGTVDVLEINDIPRPVPGPNEILVKVGATTVTAVDLAFRKGTPWAARLYTGVFKPKNRVLGAELAGTVQEVGQGVTRYRKGDRILAATKSGMGAHAEYVVLPEDGAQIKLPAQITDTQAVAISGGGLTALPFLRDHGHLRPGQSILINGASGAVGIAAVQLAKHFGADVTAVSSGQNMSFVKSIGADVTIDYAQQDFTALDRSFDVVFDVSGKSSFRAARRVLKPKGIFLATNISIGTLVAMLVTSLFPGKKAVFAATGLRPAAEQKSDLEHLLSMTTAGPYKPVIDRSYPIDHIADAYDFAENGHKKGNVVVTFPASRAAVA
ncbi:MAG: NAD(P)-dependent alcohol dehydrogenase [Marinosulfonomonas sp.]